MSEKQKMCTVMNLPTSVLASLFSSLMFTGFHNQFPVLTMVYSCIIGWMYQHTRVTIRLDPLFVNRGLFSADLKLKVVSIVE